MLAGNAAGLSECYGAVRKSSRSSGAMQDSSDFLRTDLITTIAASSTNTGLMTTLATGRGMTVREVESE